MLFSGLSSFFLSIAMLYQMSPYFQTYAEETANLGPGTIGIIFATLPFCSFIASVPAATMINRYGTRICVMFGLAVLALSSLMFGLSDSAEAWIFWRAVQGFSTAPIYGSVSVMFANTFHGPGEFSKVNGMQEAVAQIGFAVGPAMGGALFQHGGFLLPFGISALSHLPFIGLSFWTPSEEECADEKSTKLLSVDVDTGRLKSESSDEQSELEPVSLANIMTPEVLLIMPAGMIFCGVFGALDPVYARHFTDTLDVHSSSALGVLMSMPAIPSFVLALVVPFLMDRFGGHTIMTFGVALLSFCCVLIALSNPDVVQVLGWGLPLIPGSTAQWALQITIAMGIGSASACGWIPVLPDMMEKAAARVAKDRNLSREASTAMVSATVSSLFSMCTALGEAFGPIVGGILKNRCGFGGTFLLFGGILGIYLAVLIIVPWQAVPEAFHEQTHVHTHLPGKLMHTTMHLTPVKRTPRSHQPNRALALSGIISS